MLIQQLFCHDRVLSPHILGQEHYNTRGVQKVLLNYKNLQAVIAILGMDEFSKDDKLTILCSTTPQPAFPSPCLEQRMSYLSWQKKEMQRKALAAPQGHGVSCFSSQ
ncbi:hypothetical protein Taro_002094 [Colocasia esculenta]|uniref:H(+)-transporting two-sector ATPase n=1 Tax=Colocasia esculenta TaxID=4460 RepID=A0A843TMQ5_COLES|nr:hypothetical protein [Colocasia esculenta]